MSEKQEKPENLRELLLSDLKVLKQSRLDLADAKAKDVIEGLKQEKEFLVEHGGAIKKIAEIVEVLKGETITDTHVELVAKYLVYLRNQLTATQQAIKMEEESKEIENML